MSGPTTPTRPVAPQGRVRTVIVDRGRHASLHERRSLEAMAQRVAALLGHEVLADGESPPPGAHCYCVPTDTLTRGHADALGIGGTRDLFGGIVPHAFVATKVIGHPLVAADSVRVPGWSGAFAEQVEDVVAVGYTVFAREDARTAARLLLRRGALRCKPPLATGGSGQSEVHDAAGLESALDRIGDAALAEHGLVLEEQLDEERTFSVGEVEVAGIVAAYWGVQRRTRNRAGAEVFGGSSLHVVRGGFGALPTLALPPDVELAVARARRYDEAAHACWPGLQASRRNYDVLLGTDAGGVRRCVVLESSWRVGGATPAELTALECFQADPSCRDVRVSCFEFFGDAPEPPPGAIVAFRGVDPAVGPMTKYAIREAA